VTERPARVWRRLRRQRHLRLERLAEDEDVAWLARRAT
jgi:hypothetical protein